MRFRKMSFLSLLSNIVDNRGKTCPTAKEGRPLIATNCIKSENLYPTYDSIRYVDEETYCNWFRGHPKPGDILFVTKGSPGQTCLVPDPVDFCVAQDMVAIRANEEKIYPRYLLATLRSKKTLQLIENLHVGTLIPHFKKGDFDKLFLDIHKDLNDQKIIGDFYFKISEKIEHNLQMNKTLEAIAQAIFREWFVDFRFPGFDGELVDGLPKGWRILDLGDVSTLFAGGDKPINYSIQSNEQYKIPVYSNGITNEGLQGYTDKPRINEESVTVSARGTIGYVCLRLQPYVPIVRLIALIPNQNFISSKYLYLWLRNQNISGTGTTQQQLTVPDFRRSKVLIPKIEIVNQFTILLNTFFHKINSNISEIQTLTQLRDGLLSKLMTGKIKVA